MALTFTAGTAAESTASVTSTTVTLPSGLATGDYTIIAFSLNATSGVITTPAGWTNILASTNSVNGSTSYAMAIFYRKWQSGDGNPAVTTTSGRTGAIAIRVQGADGTTFVNTAASVTQAASGATTLTAPTITPSSGWLVCAFGGRNATNGVFLTPFTGLSGTMTATGSASGKSTTQTNGGHLVAYEAVTPNSATGTRQANPNAATTGAFGVSFALNEGGTPGNVAAVVATATATDITPVVSGAATLAPPASTATATDITPVVTAAATIQAIKATATTAALAPAVGVSVTSAAPVATATATGAAPAVTAAAVVLAVRAQATATASAPSATAAATVSPPAATATAAAIAPAVVAGTPGQVAAVKATATAAAAAPVVSSASDIAAIRGTATAGMQAPTVGGGYTVGATLATATAQAYAPTITTTASGNVAAPVATMSAAALVPDLHLSATVSPPAATATGQGIPPTVTALRQANVTAPLLQATMIAFAPVVTLGATLAAPAGAMTASMPAPVVTAAGPGDVAAVRAQATASATTPVVTAAAVVAAVRATATALALPPTVTGAVRLDAPRSQATAQAYAPGVTAGAALTATRATALARAWAPQVLTIDTSDITLLASPLVSRWLIAQAPDKYRVVELPDRFIGTYVPDLQKYATQELPDRFRGGLDKGDTMSVEVLASAGAIKFVGGTVTETAGLDISGASFEMSLGSEKYPGATWVAPDVSAAGTSNAQRVLKLKVSSTLPAGITVPGTYWCWARITASPEVEPVRLQGPITVR